LLFPSFTLPYLHETAGPFFSLDHFLSERPFSSFLIPFLRDAHPLRLIRHNEGSLTAILLLFRDGDIYFFPSGSWSDDLALLA